MIVDNIIITDYFIFVVKTCHLQMVLQLDKNVMESLGSKYKTKQS